VVERRGVRGVSPRQQRPGSCGRRLLRRLGGGSACSELPPPGGWTCYLGCASACPSVSRRASGGRISCHAARSAEARRARVQRAAEDREAALDRGVPRAHRDQFDVVGSTDHCTDSRLRALARLVCPTRRAAPRGRNPRRPLDPCPGRGPPMDRATADATHRVRPGSCLDGRSRTQTAVTRLRPASLRQTHSRQYLRRSAAVAQGAVRLKTTSTQ
jgi:hypothetical protein